MSATLELLELERIWPERFRPRPLLLACRAVDAETGKRCSLPAHKGEHNASGRRFSEVLRPGRVPLRLLELAHVATTQSAPAIVVEVEWGRVGKAEYERARRAKHRAARGSRG